ncbi:MAG: hypothetical protein ACLUHE_09910 [Christensenellales bacterium]
MKQTFVLLLTLMLILTASVAVAQQRARAGFHRCERERHADGAQRPAQTKKAVLLHFLRARLDEDYSDLPAVQAAYAQYGEGYRLFIVVSVEEQETVQSLAAARRRTS